MKIILTIISLVVLSSIGTPPFVNVSGDASQRLVINSNLDSIRQVVMTDFISSDSLHSQLCSSDNGVCGKWNSFQLVRPDKSPVQMEYFHDCGGFVDCGTGNLVKRILVNEKGEVLWTGEDKLFVVVDSISPLILNEYSNNQGKPMEVYISWHSKTPLKILVELLDAIIQGGEMIYESDTAKNYSKSFADMSEDELDNLKRELRFRIRLGKSIKASIPTY